MELIIQSGNENKSINIYVQQIAKELITSQKSLFKAYGIKKYNGLLDNNMNKLITITEIFKRGVSDINYKYSIGNETRNDKKVSFICATITVNFQNDNKDSIINQLSDLITSNHKRSPVTQTSNSNTIENTYISNINDFMMNDDK